MSQSFIGKPISLISHSDVRYRGTLAGIDPAASTIQLSNVYSMGTEQRRPPAEFIPPVQEPYQYIIFRASEVKDLSVDEAPQRRSVHDDPAVIGASAPMPAAVPQQPPPVQQPQHQQPQQQHQPQQRASAAPAANSTAPARAPVPRRNNSVHTAAASLETVERALGDLRVTQASNPPRRRGQGGPRSAEIKVPTQDFDFESSNARFDKAALAPKPAHNGAEYSDDGTNPSDNEDREKEKNAAKEKEKETAYNPQKSFFDSLSSSAHGGPQNNQHPNNNSHRGQYVYANNGGGGGYRGNNRRGNGRNRREEERERNVATFGEPGGVGLMGPGAYVAGWGGYGRRGARRGGSGRGGFGGHGRGGDVLVGN